MTQKPLWATPERQSQLVEFAMRYKGVCLEGHRLCPEIEHYVTVVTKTEAAWTRKKPVHGNLKLWGTTERLARRSRLRLWVQREELSDLYGQQEERAIDAWKAEDREARRFEGRTPDRHGKLRENMAPTGEVGRFGKFHHPILGGGYDPVDIDKYIENRPAYKIIGYGVNDKMQRFAKVSIPGTGIILQVDLSNSIQGVSKSKRKRLRRHGSPVQSENALCKAAVAIWWAR